MTKNLYARFLQALCMTILALSGGFLMSAEGRLEGFLFVAFFIIVFIAALIVQFRRKDD